MRALVIGGNSGVGLATVCGLLERGIDTIYVVGRNEISIENIDDSLRDSFSKRVVFIKKNLIDDNISFLKEIGRIDVLVISAGFGRVSLFENLTEAEVKNLIKVNFESAVRIIKHYYDCIDSSNAFYTAVVVSIAGRIVSPFFSVYGGAKAGLRFFIENINAELLAKKRKNRILDVSPGSLNGTSFAGGKTDISLLKELSSEIIDRMFNRQTLYIPNYSQTYRNVIERYENDPISFGQESFNFKKNSNRISYKPQVTIGYLSGTFDLFHIGHLNLLRRAKEQCDYLIVSIHKSGSWKGKETFIPYEERKAIVESIKYVDEIADDFAEDSDAWEIYHYNKLFVGSDYKGTDRFNRYEICLKGKAEIVYFPYTKGTSSTQLRNALKKDN